MASAMMQAAPRELILEGNLTANFEEHFKLLERTELVNTSEMKKVFLIGCWGTGKGSIPHF